METELTVIVRELLDFLEENDICDIHNISWVSSEDGYIESERSLRMKEIIKRVEEAVNEE